MWIHLDVVNFGVTGHGGTGGEDTGLALRTVSGRVNIREINAPLLPSGGNQVATDEAQETFTVSGLDTPEQHVGLIDAVDRSIDYKTFPKGQWPPIPFCWKDVPS